MIPGSWSSRWLVALLAIIGFALTTTVEAKSIRVVVLEDLDIPLYFNGQVVSRKEIPAGAVLEIVSRQGNELLCKGERRRFKVPLAKTNYVQVMQQLASAKQEEQKNKFASPEEIETLVETLRELVSKAKAYAGGESPRSYRFNLYASRSRLTPYLMVKPLDRLAEHPSLDPELAEAVKDLKTAVNCYRVGAYGRFEEGINTIGRPFTDGSKTSPSPSNTE